MATRSAPWSRVGLLLLLLLPCLELILELREPGSLGSSSVGRIFGGDGYTSPLPAASSACSASSVTVGGRSRLILTCSKPDARGKVLVDGARFA